MKSLSSVLALIVIFVSSAFAAQSDRITSAIDARTVEIPNHVRMQAQPKYDQGAVEPGFRMNHMTLLTTPTPAQQATKDKLIADQQNPKSPMYHHWLTPQQIADRFGLSPADIARLTGWLTAQGLKVDRVANARNFIVFSGTAAQVRAAFHTEIHHFNVEGKEHFANATNPRIPAALAGAVTGIRGLDNFLMEPNHHIAGELPSVSSQANASGRWHGNYYDPAFNSQFLAPGDVATIYDVKGLYSSANAGTGQSIAVMGQTDVYLADLQDFRAGFGLPAITGCTTDPNTLLITACSGGNFGYILLDPDNLTPSPGNLSESDLDLEWTNAVAPQATIIFVNAPVNGVTEAFYYAIDNAVAPVISLSYGACELDEGTFFSGDNAELANGALSGITFLASSGDQGAAGCDYNNTATNFLAQRGYGVSFPASSQYVTSIGGTGVPLTGFGPAYWVQSNASDGGSALGYVPEQVWNDDAELGLFCTNNPGAQFCVNNAVSNQQTAQAAIGISSGGGGVSNCTSQDSGTGACTAGITQPDWQSALTIPNQAPGRFVPDISGLASPNFPGYIVCVPQSELPKGSGSTSSCVNGIQASVEGTEAANIGSSLIGGTSASTPVYAGVVAILNQYLGSTGLGLINPQLYSLAVYAPTGFHQVTTGDNTVYCSAGTPSTQPAAMQCPSSGILGFQASNFDATTGYNLAAGLGSLEVKNLAIAWAARGSATIGLGPLPSNAYQGQALNLTANVQPSNAIGNVIFYSGTTVLGSAATTGGVATLMNPTLPLGTDAISAYYGGDTITSPSTSGIKTITVVAPFSISAAALPPATQGVATAPVTVTVTLASGYTNPGLTFSCTGPAVALGASCTFTPATTTGNPTLSVVTSAANGSSSMLTVNATNGTVTASTNLTLAVNAVAFTLTAPDAATTQGGTAGPVTITPTPAAGFTTNVTYSCATTAPEATCTLTPPAGTAVNPMTAITASITTTAPQASLQFPGKASGVFYALLLPGLFGLVLAGKGNRKGRTLMMLGFMAVLASSTMWMSACSSSSSTKNPGTPKGMYTVTVTGMAGAISNSVTFHLTVN